MSKTKSFTRFVPLMARVLLNRMAMRYPSPIGYRALEATKQHNNAIGFRSHRHLNAMVLQ
jgi:hypothetical protein